MTGYNNLPDMLQSYLQERGGDILKLPEGFVIYSQPDPSYIRIDDIYVSPEWRRCSVASHMTNQVFQIARERKCQYVEAYIEQEYKHQAAHLLYYGFTVSDECSRWVYFRKDV